MAQPRRTLTLQPTPEGIAQAAHILRHGGLVAMPTETVYGLAADALKPTAIEAIFTAKDRPHWDPLIVHIADTANLPQITSHLTATAQTLIDALWPGPLTLLLPRTPALPLAVTAGRELVGVRMPAHPVARALIAATGRPLAAPSANRFGHISPTTAAHVLADLDGRIDAVLDAGPCLIGLESTVLDPDTDPITIYRHGGISAAQIQQITGRPTETYLPPAASMSHPQALPSPGVGIRHYAPNAILKTAENQADLQEKVAALSQESALATAVLLPNGWTLKGFPGTVLPWGNWNKTAELARNLYSCLRALDRPATRIIYVPIPHATQDGKSDDLRQAIQDRLQKAARPR